MNGTAYQSRGPAIRGFAAVLAVMAALLPPPAAAEVGFTGMQVQEISPEVAAALGLEKAEGILVRDVAQGGPADKAGFMRGDLIVTFSGRDIDTLQRLVSVVGGIKAGQKVPVTVLRRGSKVSLTLKAGKRAEKWRVSKAAFATLPAVGLTLSAITGKVRASFGLRWGSNGVVITLVDMTKAQDMDLKRCEVILQVNQDDVWIPDQVLAKYRQAKKKGAKHLLLFVDGFGGYRFSLLPVR